MKLDLPDPPASFGCSKRVRRRVRESLPAVRVAFASIEILGETIERRWGEEIARHSEPWQREAREAAGDAERQLTVADLVYGIGCEIQRLATAMVEKDEALDDARRHRRRWFDRRDTARRSLYGELVDFRKHAKGILRPRRARLVPALCGETARDPRQLIQQTDDCRRWAAGYDQPPPGTEDWTALTSPLESLRDQLAAALDAIDSAAAAVQTALDLRDAAIVEFDDHYLKGSRLLERLYAYLGLPSLAAAVRPHLKVTARVGRPSKKPAPDQHPDLVAQVFARLR